jgi:hypothetical protein
MRRYKRAKLEVKDEPTTTLCEHGAQTHSAGLADIISTLENW